MTWGLLDSQRHGEETEMCPCTFDANNLIMLQKEISANWISYI